MTFPLVSCGKPHRLTGTSASSLSWHFLPLSWLAATLTGCESATHSQHYSMSPPTFVGCWLRSGLVPSAHIFTSVAFPPRVLQAGLLLLLLLLNTITSPSSSSPSSHQMELSAASDKPVPPFSHPLSTYLNSQPDTKKSTIYCLASSKYLT